MRRRAFLAFLPGALAWPKTAISDPYPAVNPGTVLRFPRDHGAHPAFRNEWWYVTGWLETRDAQELGVQVTFFRNRPRLQEDNPSAFAPKQLLFAHAAVAVPARGRLLHAQRAAREGLGLAGASSGDSHAWVDDWSLQRDAAVYRARVADRAFALELDFRPTQPILPHGERGYSRKGPDPKQASHYYSFPSLSATGSVSLDGARSEVAGQAWLDHEWSSEVLAPGAAGWDWIGINLKDGGALMAFRIRGEDGGSLWAGGTLRDARESVHVFTPSQVGFEVLRKWRSPRTGVDYPIAMRVRAGAREITLMPLMDDQELDARASTGTIYWEGAVRAYESGAEVGRGYLELTGYWRALSL